MYFTDQDHTRKYTHARAHAHVDADAQTHSKTERKKRGPNTHTHAERKTIHMLTFIRAAPHSTNNCIIATSVYTLFYTKILSKIVLIKRFL